MSDEYGGLGIPVSRRALCVYCSEIIDSNAVGVFELVQGWAENRPKGGTHAVALQMRRNKFACKFCIGKLRKGISPDQGSLFALNLYDE